MKIKNHMYRKMLLGGLIGGLFIIATQSLSAQPIIDTVKFGDADSEKNHQFSDDHSEIIQGGLNQPARHLLPLDTATYEGGRINVVMKVDGEKLNYLTVKLWGSDRGAQKGRLLLWADGKQVGYRNVGDYDVINQSDEDPLYPNRFVYVTVPLPPNLTKGHDQISLSISAVGPVWFYGTNFEQYQKNLTEATRGIYQAYVGASPLFTPPSDEIQGAPTDLPVRTSPGDEILAQAKDRVNSQLLRLVTQAPVQGNNIRKREAVILALAFGYANPWTSIYKSDSALKKIIEAGDSYASAQAADPGFVASDWPGSGPLGAAIMLVYPQLDKALEETIPGLSGTRREAWSSVLKASVDYWRTHRRDYTNQSMIVDWNIYTANSGLKLIDPDKALPADKALGYLYQAAGVTPWLGSDTPDGGSEKPYGSSYCLVTDKGLSRELGYVGTYGETIINFLSHMVRATGDEKLRSQLAKITHARTYFRYPSPDSDGFRAMRLESIIDNRTAHYPAGVAYATADVREDWELEPAAVLKDDESAGIVQQCLADDQFFPRLARRVTDNDPNNIRGMMQALDDYETVKALPTSPVRLPMSDGQPDFAWADEGDAVLVVRHGAQKLFFNFYYRAERGINGVVRIDDQTPAIERIVTAKAEFEYEPSGVKPYIRPHWIDTIRIPGFPPPGTDYDQAWAGEEEPVAARPPDAQKPAYNGWGPFLGKASFYHLQYGDYLIGMNCSAGKTYQLAVPDGRKSAPDLISGKTLSTDQSVPIPPMSTVVLYLGK